VPLVIAVYSSIAETETVPGPGTYEQKPVWQLTREITMGLPMKTSAKHGPPPNAYNVKDGIGTSSSYSRSEPAWALRSRTFVGSCYYDAFKANVPGMFNPLGKLAERDIYFADVLFLYFIFLMVRF